MKEREIWRATVHRVGHNLATEQRQQQQQKVIWKNHVKIWTFKCGKGIFAFLVLVPDMLG